MFSKECGSGLESRGGNTENGSVQAVERKGFAGGRVSKMEGEFTDEHSIVESTCQ
jgi:hypothetical protein